MAQILPKSDMNWFETIELMTADKPTRMGYPTEESQSAYYPGSEICTREEIDAVTKIMSTEKIAPENTRLRKNSAEESFEIIQASAEREDEPKVLGHLAVEDQRQFKVLLRRGDHSQEMTKICAELINAREVASTEEQRLAISQLAESFSTGNYQAFLDAQKTWIKDRAPRVEHCMGFLFGYRDPRGVRAEWQAAAGVADLMETTKMGQLVEKSPDIICTLPWAVPNENGGKGPFEPSELETPDFAIIHGEFRCQE
jgi:dipeptidyl-peptidase-3